MNYAHLDFLDRQGVVFPDVEMVHNSGDNISSNLSDRFCGFPGFCSNSDFELCGFAPLISCSVCGEARSAVFLFSMILLVLAIGIGNILIILVVNKHHKKKKLKKIDVCRASLATADILTGLQILVITFNSFNWSMHLTPDELTTRVLEINGSAEAFVGGIWYMFTITSSLYHMLYMGLLRLLAVKKPFTYRNLSIKTVSWQLVIVWILSLLAASSPGWVPSQSTFSFHVPILLYHPTMEPVAGNAKFPYSVAFVMVFFILPFLILLTSLIGSEVLIECKERKKRDIVSSSKKTKRAGSERTVIFMALGFTVLMFPLSVVTCLVYSEDLDCSSASTPRLICTYIAMISSCINVGFYTWRGNIFPETLKEILLPIRCSKKQPTLNSNKTFVKEALKKSEGSGDSRISKNNQELHNARQEVELRSR